MFYGWRMVGAACGIRFLLAAFLTQVLGLYIAVLSDEMGWSKTTLSGAAALQSVEAAIIGPVLGWVMDRVGPQKMIRLGMVLFSAGLLLLSQVNSVTTFYVSAVLMAIGASLGGYFPLSAALVPWFEKFRARALSIMSLGLAMGGLVVPLMAWSMQQWGWRATAAGSGVLVLLTGLLDAGHRSWPGPAGGFGRQRARHHPHERRSGLLGGHRQLGDPDHDLWPTGRGADGGHHG